MSDKNQKVVVAPENPVLAAIAVAAVTDRSYPLEKLWCQRFVKLIVRKFAGGRYDAYHKASAELSRQAWAKSPYAVDPRRGSVIGDILYKAGDAKNPDGHVGVRVPGNRVAENSSTGLGRVQGAKGYRSLEQFGKVDLIVRLPRR